MFVGHDFRRQRRARLGVQNDSSPKLAVSPRSAFCVLRSENQAWVVRQDRVDADENRVGTLP